MAVNSTLKKKTGSMRFKIGVDSKGNDVFRTVTLTNIDENSTDDNILAILKAVNGIMDPMYVAREWNKDEKYSMSESV